MARIDLHKWIADVNDAQKTTLEFPIAADPDLKIPKLYEMIHPDESGTAAVRSVFIIDLNKKIRLTMTYPPSVSNEQTKELFPQGFGQVREFLRHTSL